jgi:acetolactate synthase-1/2/3 large subunit
VEGRNVPQDQDQVTTGAEALLSSLVGGGVDVCFANPGTSEMHFVAALDQFPAMRCVLGLSEGVVTGAADGYGRMTGKPAASLLHLGPGLANGIANLHNARRAHTPLVVVVGDHATYHKRYDPPLESDIDALAGTVSRWVRRSSRPESVGTDAIAAIKAARQGGIATLILPADVSWQPGGIVGEPSAPDLEAKVPNEVLDRVEVVLRSGEPAIILVGGSVVAADEPLAAAAAIANSAGATLLGETFPARAVRGTGRPRLGRLAYPVDFAIKQLAGARHLILAGASLPIAQFAYPGKPSVLIGDDCQVHDLGGGADDGVVEALLELATRLAAPPSPVAVLQRPELPSGKLTAEGTALVVAALMPENSIVVDESITSGATLGSALKAAPRHDMLTLPGGAIGFGLPAATGAAVACADRPVLCLEGDGSAIYTIAALWTQAREQLNVTTVIYDNRSYAILRRELGAVEAKAIGPLAERLLTLDRPALDFVAIAQGFGVSATRADTAEGFAAQLRAAFAEPGPHLICASISG